MNTRNNVSSRVAMDSFRFQRKPPITLQTGRPATINLRNREGIAIFRYRPRDNATTQFNILACGACSARAKFRAPEYYTVGFSLFFFILLQLFSLYLFICAGPTNRRWTRASGASCATGQKVHHPDNRISGRSREDVENKNPRGRRRCRIFHRRKFIHIKPSAVHNE